MPITRNRTSSPAGNKNSHSITQSVMDKNRSTSNWFIMIKNKGVTKEPQRAVETIPETP